MGRRTEIVVRDPVVEGMRNDLERRFFTRQQIANIMKVLHEEAGREGQPSFYTGVLAIRSWANHGDDYMRIICRLKGEPV